MDGTKGAIVREDIRYNNNRLEETLRAKISTANLRTRKDPQLGINLSSVRQRITS